jgi:hypothetical protein
MTQTKSQTLTIGELLKTMYKVKELQFADLNSAMDHAKSLNEFVTISGPDFEVCGRFGVDSVKDGVCPDGVVYDWNKASRIGGMKKERV